MNEKEENKTFVPEKINEVITIEQTEDLITIAQRRVDIVEKMMNTALKITTHRDWVNQSGRPYLVHSGAEKVARLFGITLSDIKTGKVWTEDSKGKYYIYKTTGKASLPGKFDSIEALGTCSQRDKFFGFANGQWRDTIEIDETNVMKASYSNFVVNSITHLLGLRNITWDILEEAKIDVSKIQKVEYGKGKEKISKATSEKDKETQKKLWDLLIQLKAGNEEEARELLKQESGFKSNEGDQIEGKTDVKYLTGKWLNFTCGKIKKLAEQQGERLPGEEG